MVVAPRHPRDDVVAGAHRLGPGGLLGAPAHRQPLAGRPGAGGGLAARRRPRGVRRAGRARPHRRPRRPRRPRRRPARTPTAGATPGTSGDCTLVVIDSRAARDLRPDSRSMLDAGELEWLDGVLRGGSRHVLIGTSLPFLLPPGLHDFEAMNEAMAQGAYGRRVAHGGRADAPHHRPRALGRLQPRLRRGLRHGHGGRPRRARPGPRDGDLPVGRRPQLLPRRGHRPARRSAPRSRVVQAVCSPIRNPMPRGVRVVMSLFARSLVRPMRFVASHSRRVPDPPFPWTRHRRAVVRQQHRAVPRRARRPRARVGHRCRRGRPGPPAPAHRLLHAASSRWPPVGVRRPGSAPGPLRVTLDSGTPQGSPSVGGAGPVRAPAPRRATTARTPRAPAPPRRTRR